MAAADEDDDYMGDLERFIPKEELLPTKPASQVKNSLLVVCRRCAQSIEHVIFHDFNVCCDRERHGNCAGLVC